MHARRMRSGKCRGGCPVDDKVMRAVCGWLLVYRCLGLSLALCDVRTRLPNYCVWAQTKEQRDEHKICATLTGQPSLPNAHHGSTM